MNNKIEFVNGLYKKKVEFNRSCQHCDTYQTCTSLYNYIESDNKELIEEIVSMYNASKENCFILFFIRYKSNN